MRMAHTCTGQARCLSASLVILVASGALHLTSHILALLGPGPVACFVALEHMA